MFLQARLADMQASETIFDLPIGNANPNDTGYTLEYKNSFSIKLTHGYRALAAGQQYDWNTVRRVKIMGINNVA